jgi:hypothetical protein
MPSAGFEPAIPETQQPQPRRLRPRSHWDRLAFVVGNHCVTNSVPRDVAVETVKLCLCTTGRHEAKRSTAARGLIELRVQFHAAAAVSAPDITGMLSELNTIFIV